MKIKRITIDSFGSIRGWTSGELTENLTVIYGPNEAGKSTITEFIRSTLFPGRSSRYPQPAKTDSGIIEVTMDGGDERVLVREQKTVNEGSGKLLINEEFPNMDSDAFRTLYCIDLDGLTDKRIISSDDFKSQFLTIPGGDRVNDISKSINDTLDSLMTKEKLTENRTIGRCLKEIRSDERRLAEIHSEKGRYDALATEKADLIAKIDEKKKADKLMRDEESKLEIIRSQSINLSRLGEMQSELTQYEEFKDIDLSSRTRYELLKSRIEQLSSEMKFDAPDSENYSAVIAKKDPIKAMWESKPAYIANVDKLSHLRELSEGISKEIADLETSTGWKLEDAKKINGTDELANIALEEMNSSRSNKMKYGGAAASAVGIAGIACGAILNSELSIPIICAGGAILIIGGYILIKSFRDKKKTSKIWDDWSKDHGLPEGMSPHDAYMLSPKLGRMVELSERSSAVIMEREETERLISEYVNSSLELFSSLDVTVTDLDTDINALHDMLVKAESSLSHGEECAKELTDKTAEMSEFLKRYGSEEGFMEALDGKEKYDKLEKDIAMLIQSIESSASMSIEDLNNVLMDESSRDMDIIGDIDEMNLRIGEINSEMAALMDDEEIDSILEHKISSETALDEALYKWAVNSIAGNIIDRVCDYYYNDLQPDLLWTANHYLGIMTEGRYQLDSDPREKDIAVKDEYRRKTSNQWSSGLGDQIYLSLKMAMAKEIGTEAMPMILDDVVVRFDSDRKMNACKAIYELSRTNQVIVFTCESSLRNYFGLCGKFNEIKL